MNPNMSVIADRVESFTALKVFIKIVFSAMYMSPLTLRRESTSCGVICPKIWIRISNESVEKYALLAEKCNMHSFIGVTLELWQLH